MDRLARLSPFLTNDLHAVSLPPSNYFDSFANVRIFSTGARLYLLRVLARRLFEKGGEVC